MPDQKNEIEEKPTFEINETKIKERIAAIEKERDDFIKGANMQIAAYNGALGELRKLIEPEKTKKK